MTTDFYKEAREIAKRLKHDGLTAESEALVNAIECGSTGTEILIALRWNLDRIDNANCIADLEMLRRIRNLRQSVSVALGE